MAIKDQNLAWKYANLFFPQFLPSIMSYLDHLGFYCDNSMWKRNTAIAAAGMALLGVWIFKVSVSYERRMRPGPIPVPSQSWAAHTLVDDPSYPEKLANWQKNKPSLWDRIFQTKKDFREE
jgi:hypothetical protein